LWVFLAEGIAECHYTGPQPVTAAEMTEGLRHIKKQLLRLVLLIPEETNDPVQRNLVWGRPTVKGNMYFAGRLA
jgi:hypothetical protein